ncbi:MAG: nucleotide exchange factor GrpE [Eubacteriales bacterium]|nr:nucleotide exchange factor GrpE [Eubacteriales bacterium]
MSKKKEEEIKETCTEERAPEAEETTETPASAPTPDLEAALKAAQDLADEYKLMAQRERADLENYKRRNASLRADAYDDGVSECAARLLPVMDNLERALAAAEKSEDFDALLEGVRAIAKQFAAALADVHVTPIEALNAQFDPAIHNAVLHTEEEGVPENTVTAEMLKGYMYKDKVLRHSMVKVTN